jgi:hypothetical protein
MHFLVFKKNLPLKRYEMALTTGTFWEKKFDEKHRCFLFDSNFDLKKIVFESSVLA